MPADDDVQLPDLQIIQQFSLAVRGATASRQAVLTALEADLTWLKGGSRSSSGGSTGRSATPRPARATATKTASKAAAKRTRRA